LGRSGPFFDRTSAANDKVGWGRRRTGAAAERYSNDWNNASVKRLSCDNFFPDHNKKENNESPFVPVIRISGR
jgi:hypothetical protein